MGDGCMILINLLPPELRKRHGGISPAFASIVVGGVVNVLLLLGWLFLLFIREPHAARELDDRNKQIVDKKVLADKVNAEKAEIQKHLDRRNKIVGLINSKMYWAHTLDEFSNRLTANSGNWLVPGFEVRASELSIKEMSDSKDKPGAKKGGDIIVNFAFKWKYKIVGMGPIDKSGDYMKAFFKTIEKDPFWKNNGFIDNPDKSYHGFQPKWNDEIKRLIIENTLDWVRSKTVAQIKGEEPKPKAPAKGAAAAPAKPGAPK
jgi:hypothetical protein